MAPILPAVMDFLHTYPVFLSQKVRSVLVLSVWNLRENVPLKIKAKLRPKNGNIRFCDCFTDGHCIFHFCGKIVYFLFFL